MTHYESEPIWIEVGAWSVDDIGVYKTAEQFLSQKLKEIQVFCETKGFKLRRCHLAIDPIKGKARP